MNYPNQINIGEKIIPIEYQNVRGLRSTCRFNKGEIKIRLSRYLIGKKRDNTVDQFLEWVKKKASKYSINDFVLPVFKDGAHIVTHNKVYQINVLLSPRKSSKVFLKDDFLIEILLNENMSVPDQEKNIKFLIEKIVMADQYDYLCEVIKELNGLYFQEKVCGLRFKRMSSRFGSCSSKRNINISYHLLFTPREVFRYVCAHELAHLKEMNHSSRFWALVYEACPDFRVHKKWLRENGFMLG